MCLAFCKLVAKRRLCIIYNDFTSNYQFILHLGLYSHYTKAVRKLTTIKSPYKARENGLLRSLLYLIPEQFLHLISTENQILYLPPHMSQFLIHLCYCSIVERHNHKKGQYKNIKQADVLTQHKQDKLFKVKGK